jgi:uncharacterized protein (DUF1778 family)
MTTMVGAHMAARLKVVRGAKAFPVKLTETERKALAKAAFLSEQALGAFIREAALKAAKRLGKAA